MTSSPQKQALGKIISFADTLANSNGTLDRTSACLVPAEKIPFESAAAAMSRRADVEYDGRTQIFIPAMLIVTSPAGPADSDETTHVMVCIHAKADTGDQDATVGQWTVAAADVQNLAAYQPAPGTNANIGAFIAGMHFMDVLGQKRAGVFKKFGLGT